MRVKGLREIKTFTGHCHKIELGKISSLKIAQQSTTSSRTKTYTPKTWVFISEPKFSRYHRNLLVDRSQEPLTEIFEEAESVVVIADMPGVINTDDIRLKAEGDVLIIEAIGNTIVGNRKYCKEILLPFPIDDANLCYTVNNGMMEATFHPKIKEENDE